jgi:hypothetical protein
VTERGTSPAGAATLPGVPVLRLSLLGTALAVCRLPPAADIPAWAGRDGGGFLSVTRTGAELSVVCAEHLVPPGVSAERGWRAFEVQGPMQTGASGVLAAIAAPLADARLPVFVVSTFDTDYVLVRGDDVEHASRALVAVGHALEGPG